MPVEQFIYTDRPRGKGVDPACAGYQVAACSAGLDSEARRQLSSICMHYGEAVYRFAPRSAKEKEQQWRATTQTLDAIPEEVLNEFPVIWSYDQLAENQYALTRICYAGLTHDKRTGNFFAHSLVFSPEELRVFDHNPLALSHSGLFLRKDPGTDTSLPSLPDLGAPVQGVATYQILLESPYREQIESLVSAMVTAITTGRSALICVSDQHQAPVFLEELPAMLPPEARCRITFCTHESDRRWLIPLASGARPEKAAAHDVLVLCNPEGKSFDLGPEEYQTTFTVFNFVENRFSPAQEVSPYATFAAACAKDGSINRLKNHHAVVERLGFGRVPDAWDTLVPAAHLAGSQTRVQALPEAIQAVSTLATRPAQAKAALDLILPHLSSFFQSDDTETLSSITDDLAALVDRISDRADAQSFYEGVRNLTVKVLAEGRANSATVMLKCCGHLSDEILLASLTDVLSGTQHAPGESKSDEDRNALVDLLLNGLRLSGSAPDSPQNDRLLIACFEAAEKAGRTEMAWSAIGETVVKPRLAGDWNEEKIRLLKALSRSIRSDRAPEANIWLNLRLLEATKPEGKELLERLKELAKASSRSPAAETLSSDLLRLVRENFSGEQQLEAFGHLAEAAEGTDAGDRFFAAYQGGVTTAEGKEEPADRKKLRRQLSEQGIVATLCREMLDELHEVEEGKFTGWFQSWWDVVLKPQPRILDHLRQEVAGMLQEGASEERILQFADVLIPKQQAKMSSEPGLISLIQILSESLPVGPLVDEWSQRLPFFPDRLPPETKARLQVLNLLREIEALSKQQNWSCTRFPYDNPAWSNAEKLDSEERMAILQWCTNSFSTSGITTAEEAEAFIRMMEKAGEGSADQIADFAIGLIRSRDPVTQVLVAVAFAELSFGAHRPKSDSVAVTKAIVARLDRSTRKMLEEHLDHRFHPMTAGYDERLAEFRMAANLATSKPRPTAPGERKGEARVAEKASGAGIQDRAKRFWKKLTGNQEGG